MASKQPKEGISGREIIYDENGKPCRSCNTLLDFQLASGKISNKKAAAQVSGSPFTLLDSSAERIPGSERYVKIEPPDVNELGRSSWTLLHAISANYPINPTEVQKAEMRQFLQLFSRIYPCASCASDFEQYFKDHAPKLQSRDEFGRWLCEAHNEVNAKLNKEKFNCNFWRKRWRDGWED